MLFIFQNINNKVTLHFSFHSIHPSFEKNPSFDPSTLQTTRYTFNIQIQIIKPQPQQQLNPRVTTFANFPKFLPC